MLILYMASLLVTLLAIAPLLPFRRANSMLPLFDRSSSLSGGGSQLYVVLLGVFGFKQLCAID
jgi:hypothetical protein